MKRPVQKVFILTAIAVLVFMSIAGCDQQGAANKKSRLIATENMQLKKDLQQRDKELQEQKLLLEKCLAEKRTLKKRSLDDTKDLFDKTFNKIVEKTKKLHEENKNLKLQIEELKKATKGAEGQPSSEAKPSSEVQPGSEAK
jgi:hypothetical protein